MQIKAEEIRKEALIVFKDAFHGLTFDNWCEQVQKVLKNVDITQIRPIIEEIIKNYWKVEHIIQNNEKIYVYHDIIK